MTIQYTLLMRKRRRRAPTSDTWRTINWEITSHQLPLLFAKMINILLRSLKLLCKEIVAEAATQQWNTVRHVISLMIISRRLHRVVTLWLRWVIVAMSVDIMTTTQRPPSRGDRLNRRLPISPSNHFTAIVLNQSTFSQLKSLIHLLRW